MLQESADTRLGFDNLSAPQTQNETVDVILTLHSSIYRISVKTVTESKNELKFERKSAPNNHFCTHVMAFYIDRKTNTRTHVSILSARDVYDNKAETFMRAYSWSTTKRPKILKHRIELKTENVAQEIAERLSLLMMK